MAFVAAILLAAGESSRMGQQKALLQWQGKPLIEYQLDQLSSIDDIRQVIVVTGHAPVEIEAIAKRFGISQVARNADYASGKVSSILSGLDALLPGADAVMLLAVDQPRPASLLQTLVRAHLDAGAAITAPIHAGRQGHPIIFSRALLPELCAITEESMGIRAVVTRHAGDTQRVDVDDPVIHLDLNTPSDVPVD
jgi:CTP:molybdopterin cytidylyltransferase MocA